MRTGSSKVDDTPTDSPAQEDRATEPGPRDGESHEGGVSGADASRTVALAGGEALTGVFAGYPGPALLLDRSANPLGLNPAGKTLARHLGGDGGVTVMPQLVQLAVKARIAREGLTRELPAPNGRGRLEITILPQADGTMLVLGRDFTLDASIRTALAESRTRFKDLVDLAADFAWETDIDGCFTFVSARGALGYPPENLAGQPARDLIIDPDSAPAMLPFEAREAVRNVELWMRAGNGEARCLAISAAPMRDGVGVRAGARGIAIDITRERRQQAELAEMKSRERLVQYILSALRGAVEPEQMLAAAAAAVARAASAPGAALRIFDHDQVLLEASYGAAPEAETLEAAGARIIAADKVVEGSTRTHRWIGIAGRHSGETVGIISLWRESLAGDWSGEERRLLEAVEQHFAIAFRQIADQIQLEKLSRTDDLTGLLNRRAFFEDLAIGLQRCWRRGEGGALLYIDLDNFKPINDRHGHETGDRVLCSLGECLRKGTRGYDLTARLGGDEFAIWLEGAAADIARHRAEAFIAEITALDTGMAADGGGLGASVGIVMVSPDPSLSEAIGGVEPPNVATILAAADSAMYRAKEEGKRGTRFADGTISRGARDGSRRDRDRAGGANKHKEPDEGEG
ncbi:sensor domain-containing diguanylate cyclase [Marivibrio halodurans]|uniref:Sensor domain-containing diguanylate cyclase n=1 Tax=Marivibrio halodurans TaxID=2039722 RepID=A0A8J7S3X2_9PROT|nr:sensor domain-containing diguanylate cyclase [Marivibrio halodurans]MBP5858103.1 sensor domain-containing diguanylate cyclase [Marivibrio halodurans]